jgi:hypothetical protein
MVNILMKHLPKCSYEVENSFYEDFRRNQEDIPKVLLMK